MSFAGLAILSASLTACQSRPQNKQTDNKQTTKVARISNSKAKQIVKTANSQSLKHAEVSKLIKTKVAFHDMHVHNTVKVNGQADLAQDTAVGHVTFYSLDTGYKPHKEEAYVKNGKSWIKQLGVWAQDKDGQYLSTDKIKIALANFKDPGMTEFIKTTNDGRQIQVNLTVPKTQRQKMLPLLVKDKRINLNLDNGSDKISNKDIEKTKLLQYQYIETIDMATKKISKIEANVKWQLPELSHIRSEKFTATPNDKATVIPEKYLTGLHLDKKSRKQQEKQAEQKAKKQAEKDKLELWKHNNKTYNPSDFD